MHIIAKQLIDKKETHDEIINRHEMFCNKQKAKKNITENLTAFTYVAY